MTDTRDDAVLRRFVERFAESMEDEAHEQRRQGAHEVATALQRVAANVRKAALPEPGAAPPDLGPISGQSTVGTLAPPSLATDLDDVRPLNARERMLVERGRREERKACAEICRVAAMLFTYGSPQSRVLTTAEESIRQRATQEG